MKKSLLIVIGLLMFMSLSSFASETRTKVMGENDMIMVDDYNIFLFPGRINNYPDLALGEFSQGGDLHNFGITWQFNDDNPWVLGTFISTLPPVFPIGYPEANMDDPRIVVEPNSRFDLFYGRQIASVNFGTHFSCTRNNLESLDTVVSHTDSTAGVMALVAENKKFSYYKFGIGLTESTSGVWDIKLSVGLGSPNHEWFNDTDSLDSWITVAEPDGYYDFDVAARYFRVASPKITWAPHFAFGFGRRGGATLVEGRFVRMTYFDATTEKHSSFDIGIGMNYTSGPNLLAVLDFGVARTKITQERTRTYIDETVFAPATYEKEYKTTTLPYIKIGFEGEVLSWMDVRLGATTYLSSHTETGPSADGHRVTDTTYAYDYHGFNEKQSGRDNHTYFGLGLHWGRLYIDTYVDPQLVLDGFNFISGNTEARNMNYQVSFTYEMF